MTTQSDIKNTTTCVAVSNDDQNCCPAPRTLGSAAPFAQDTPANRENFPSATQFKQLCNKINFNRVLDMVKAKMFSSNLSNQPFARVFSADTAPFPATSVDEVKVFLTTQGYTITEIEDVVGICQGWKISW